MNGEGGAEASSLPHGWTLDELTEMARWVAHSQRGRVIDREEATDAAALALVERLYAEPAPTKLDLYRAARSAVDTANDREISYLGLTRKMKRDGREGMTPSFARYWGGKAALNSPFEDRLVERIAVLQVWNALSSTHRQTFNALISQGTLEAAGEMLGVQPTTFRMRLYRARQEARALWHWPEPPAEQWGRDHPGRGPSARGVNQGLERLAKKRRTRDVAA